MYIQLIKKRAGNFPSYCWRSVVALPGTRPPPLAHQTTDLFPTKRGNVFEIFVYNIPRKRFLP